MPLCLTRLGIVFASMFYTMASGERLEAAKLASAQIKYWAWQSTPSTISGWGLSTFTCPVRWKTQVVPPCVPKNRSHLPMKTMSAGKMGARDKKLHKEEIGVAFLYLRDVFLRPV